MTCVSCPTIGKSCNVFYTIAEITMAIQNWNLDIVYLTINPSLDGVIKLDTFTRVDSNNNIRWHTSSHQI